MAEQRFPAAPKIPERIVVLGSAAAASVALTLLAGQRYGASLADWPGLAAAAATLFLTGLAILVGAPKGWRWVGATVCAHLGLHPWLAEAAALNPLSALSTAVAALTAWTSLEVAGEQRLQGWVGGLLLGFLVGLSALVRPDLPALTLPLAALALGLSKERPSLWSSLAVFAATAVAASLLGWLLRWQVFGLNSLWTSGSQAGLAQFLQINAVGITAGLAALALLGRRAWRQATLLFLPLLIFAGITLWRTPQPDGTQDFYLPLLPLTAVIFGVLLARALDERPALRPNDTLGKIAALILGLIFILHLLPLETGPAGV